jgi:hypothetical protein
MLQGVCCEFCRKKETDECPVTSASPWSRWKNFCSEYEKGNHLDALTIREAVTNEIENDNEFENIDLG